MDKNVNLLYVQNDDEMGHFIWIKDLTSWARILVKKSTENIFAIGKYTINKSKVFVLKIKK